MTLFPMFMKLESRSCLVVGAGTIGEPKIGSLIAAGASVRVVALRVTDTVAEWTNSGTITWEARAFNVADLDGAFLVIAATNSRETNAMIFNDFYYPAVVQRGDFQIAISTNGQSPALAQRIRRELEIQFGPEYGGWLQELGRIRQQLFAARIDPEARRRVLHELASRGAFEAARSAGFNIELTSLEKMS